MQTSHPKPCNSAGESITSIPGTIRTDGEKSPACTRNGRTRKSDIPGKGHDKIGQRKIPGIISINYGDVSIMFSSSISSGFYTARRTVWERRTYSATKSLLRESKKDLKNTLPSVNPFRFVWPVDSNVECEYLDAKRAYPVKI